MKWYGKYGRKASWKVKRYEKYGGKVSRIVIRYGKVLIPYLVVLVDGILAVFWYLKEYLLCLIVIKSCKYKGLVLLTILYSISNLCDIEVTITITIDHIITKHNVNNEYLNLKKSNRHYKCLNYF